MSAADYNVDYTVSVVDTNCAGNSAAGENSFRVGEFCAVYLKDGCLHSTEGMITYPPYVQNRTCFEFTLGNKIAHPPLCTFVSL